ncbi:MAG: hypothetical protein M5U12_34830 [Verrucomicrobia bacterium]|nr:hypothetical protein [Verrucomicrobiota bacterium]
MPHPPALPSSKRVLDPYDRVSEVLFGLIMVLTFTGTLSIAEAGRDDVRTMLIGALGCNLAWGIIDGVFYLMGCLAERGRNWALLLAVRRAPDVPQAHRILGDLLPRRCCRSCNRPISKCCASGFAGCPNRFPGCASNARIGPGRSLSSCWFSFPPSL